MSAGRDAFLSRWSRRKLEGRREETTSNEAPAPEAQELSPPAPPPVDAQPELTAEEIAALPKIEELTAESDLTAFLRKGVPEVLRNAALRRIWAVDPMVRDYVGDARDYAYDWNVPGGVPGNGPLSPATDVRGAIEQMFSKGPDDARELARREPTESEVPGSEAAAQPPLPSSSVRLDDPASRRADADSSDPAGEAEPGSPVRVPPRRHGGAVPA